MIHHSTLPPPCSELRLYSVHQRGVEGKVDERYLSLGNAVSTRNHPASRRPAADTYRQAPPSGLMYPCPLPRLSRSFTYTLTQTVTVLGTYRLQRSWVLLFFLERPSDSRLEMWHTRMDDSESDTDLDTDLFSPFPQKWGYEKKGDHYPVLRWRP